MHPRRLMRLRISMLCSAQVKGPHTITVLALVAQGSICEIRTQLQMGGTSYTHL